MKRLIIIFSLCIIFGALRGQVLPGVVASQGGAASFPEMISNGTFDNATGWTLTDPWTISGGAANFRDEVGDGDIISQSDANMVSSITANTDYTLKFDVIIIGEAASAYIRIYNTNYGVTYVAADYYFNGSHTINFTTPADVGVKGIAVYSNTGSSAAWKLDNVSLKLR